MTKQIVNLLLAFTLAFALSAGAQTVAPATPEQVNKLVAVLKSDATRKEKADACRQLAIIGTKDAVAPLAALLTDPEMSHMARYALEPLKDPAVDQALRDALPKVKGRLQAGVISSLGVRRDVKAVEPLTGLLKDADPMIAQAAARALGSIGTMEAARVLQQALTAASAENQLAFAEGTFRCAEALAAKGEKKAALAIYEQLRQAAGPHQVRAGAVRGAILTQKNGEKLLAESLRSADYVVFAAAAQAAMEMPGKGVTKVLIASLEQLDADHQVLVLQTLGKRGEATAIPAVAKFAKSGVKLVRLAAVRALGEIGSPAAIPALQSLLNDSEREIARAAQESFASFQGKAADAAVISMLGSTDATQQINALELIARRRMTFALPAVLQTAKKGDEKVKVTALKQIGELGAASDAPVVMDLLISSKSPAETDAAEQALSSLCAKAEKPEVCVEAINRTLASAQPAQKSALLRVLTSLGGAPALQTVRTAVKDANPEVRDAAIRALGSWKTAEAGPDLLELAKNAPDAKQKTLSLRNYLSLASNGELPAQQRLAMCREAASLVQQTDDKKMLLAALGGINSAASVEQIVPHLGDAATREEAGAAIVGIADRLLKGQNAAQAAPKLIQPLEKVIQAVTNADLVQRAKTLLQQAKSKAS